ncbi:MAG: sn-glycerol-3-phosphate ABC transporter ATP-binding protein UgpC [Myxococcales bacterium]|nr:sn-glycerol-3-phosphate ABC transporter ATP-binding protein UgpC [Myxococcales bacterium]
MARVELDSVGKRYPNGFEAVHAFDIDIADGEFIVLVGPSGCGKSTTLRMVAGLETISSGSLRIDGKQVNHLPPKARDVAMVFQSYALYPHMTVFENMAFGLRLQKVPAAEIEERVRSVAERLGIAALLDRRPKEMSGGQRQRVAMGRAIVRRPRVFLFDEPLSNLDAKLRLQMRVEISRLHDSLGATSLYVTHDQVEAMTLADRIVLMKDGFVQQIGAPLALYARPSNTFVATFVGSPAMNLLPGTVQGGRVVGAGFDLPLPAGSQATPGQAVLAGVRPEHLRRAEGAGALSGTVDVVEPMGNESFVHCAAGEHRVVARWPGFVAPARGETVALAADPEHVHLFDAASEQRL